MKKALLLTYYWPPGSGPGVQRWLKFCKYLSEGEWEIEVITVANGSYPSVDESLLQDVPKNIRVFKTKTIEPFALYNALRGKKGKQVEVGMSNLKGKSSWFKRLSNYVRANYFIPDARVGWNTYAFSTAVKRAKAFKPDMIITTGPPHSTHLMGERLKTLFQIPWIADFRDPWTGIYYNSYLNRTESTKKKDHALEQKVLTQASGVVVASTGMREEFESQAQNIRFIPNGFDPEDFKQDPNNETRSTLRIAYVGNLKSNQNIDTFWNTLSALKKNQGIFLELEVTGNTAQDVLESLRNKELGDVVNIKAFVPHLEAINRMLSAHVLFLPIPQSDNNQHILTGKLFEYLATRRPIFAVGPKEGNASEILQACGKAKMLDYGDEEGMKDRLIDLFNTFKENNGSTWISGNDAYLQYSRKETTATLSQFMNELLA